MSIKISDDLLTIKLEKEIEFVTPGLDKILGNPYHILVERVVGYEE